MKLLAILFLVKVSLILSCLFVLQMKKKNTKKFQGSYPNPHQSSAIDLGEITNEKKCDDKIHVVFYFNYLMTGRDRKGL